MLDSRPLFLFVKIWVKLLYRLVTILPTYKIFSPPPEDLPIYTIGIIYMYSFNFRHLLYR